MADNKRMNSECSIWRVLIFNVNFAPGYPRRYAGSVWIGRLMPRTLRKRMLANARKASDLQNSKTGSERITEKTDSKTTHATMELSLDLPTE